MTCAAPCTPPCTRIAYCNALCQGHYRRKLRGVPLDTPIQRSLERRLEPVTVDLPKYVVETLDTVASGRGADRSEVARDVLSRWARMHLASK